MEATPFIGTEICTIQVQFYRLRPRLHITDWMDLRSRSHPGFFGEAPGSETSMFMLYGLSIQFYGLARNANLISRMAGDTLVHRLT